MDKIALDFPKGPTFVMDASNQPECGYWLIGRSAESDVYLSDPWVSVRHAMIQVHPGDATEGGTKIWEWTISDLGSSNGTRVNGALISKKKTKSRFGQPLEEGDKIGIGQSIMVCTTPNDTEQAQFGDADTPSVIPTHTSPSWVPDIFNPAWAWFTAKGSAEQFIFMLAIGGIAAGLLYIWTH